MVCKADTRCILVQAKRPYVQCSLLLMLLCTGMLIAGGYKLVERGMAPRSLGVGAFECFGCVLSTLPLLGVVFHLTPSVEGPSLPFYSMQREGSGYSIWMYEK
jgi:hypothetical protein